MMVVGLLFGNKLCKSVNEELVEKVARLQLEHEGQYMDFIESGEITEIPKLDLSPYLTNYEKVCQGQQ